MTREDAFIELGIFAKVEEAAGWPDGIAVDEADGVWVVLWDGAGVRRYAPNGSSMQSSSCLDQMRPRARSPGLNGICW
jgi:sugar lactone lactonase YvrE